MKAVQRVALIVAPFSPHCRGFAAGRSGSAVAGPPPVADNRGLRDVTSNSEGSESANSRIRGSLKTSNEREGYSRWMASMGARRAARRAGYVPKMRPTITEAAALTASVSQVTAA